MPVSREIWVDQKQAACSIRRGSCARSVGIDVRLLIVEPRAHGHHFSLYLRLILAEAQARGWATTLLTTQDALDHRAMQTVAELIDRSTEVFVMPRPRQWMAWHPLALLTNQVFYLYACWTGWLRLENRRFDAALMMDLDSADKLVAMLGSPFGRTPLVGLLVHAKHHRLEQASDTPGWRVRLLRGGLMRLLAQRSVRAVCVIDAAFATFRDDLPAPIKAKLRTILEPAAAAHMPDRSGARQQLGLAEHEFLVLVYGALSPRKGISNLIEAIDAESSGFAVAIVAGLADAAVRELLNGELAQRLIDGGRLRVIARYIDASEESALFVAADALWLGYSPDFDGQSALLPIAAAFRLPVFARPAGPIGALVARWGLGLLLQPESVPDVVGAIQRLQSDGELRRRIRENASRFAAERGTAGFSGAICDAIAAVG